MQLKVRKFMIEVAGIEAFIEYEMHGDNVMDLNDTFVPENYRGQGLHLAKFALKFVGKNELKYLSAVLFKAIWKNILTVRI